MKTIKWLIHDQRGDAGWLIYYSVAIIITISFCFILGDHLAISFIDSRTTEVVDDLNRDVYSLLDVQYTSDTTGFRLTDESKAYNLFADGLRSRLDLSSVGQARINQWKIVNEGDLPYMDGHGRTMMHPGIITDITIPIRTPLLGIVADKRILITTEIYR
ncbi:hypothetical protein AV654_19540 [Paenibacillus elgii]|uniref:Uncharacterized protein n=1 Tax=Paenibacillus elgii TaxID=189691 RepID=A0A163XNB3_9BACL|nr:hypothetical protein [Paenibacillus elgii]KZE78171.1 hypothetical protein AV654_19540 [Paenibacillus elgii]